MITLLLAAPLFFGQAQQGALTLPWVFSDHMVLQRELPIPVWGTATAGADVHVVFGDATANASANQDGHWRADLPAQTAESEGRALIVSAADEELRYEDVVVGEVWLCAGQSNMDFALSRAEGGKAAAASASELSLRLCDRKGSPGGGRQHLTEDEIAGIANGAYYSGSWGVASSDVAASFSAVGFFFGRELASTLDVPIGLIDVSIGGSTTEGWLPVELLRADPVLAPLAEDFLATHLSHSFIRERTAYQLGEREGARPRHFFEPGYLHEAAIETLAPYALRGALWYQGESNAHLPDLAGRLFRMLVAQWRADWQRPELPIYFVQLPGMERPTWPRFRDVQASWLDLPGVDMAVAIDVGHPTDVHPKNKQPVGERLARVALAQTYGRDIAHAGPAFDGARRKGSTLELSFKNASDLAWAAGRQATGFEVAGKDRRFYPAKAEIRGEKIVVESIEVERPEDVRYAWSPFPDWSLVGTDSLPAAPFRSYAWEPVRIACIGDSITAGYGLTDPAQESYPALLQERAGDGFDVRNYGHSGTCVVQSTMKGDWERAFRKNAEHADALLFAPDIVVSNLGINDIMAWGATGDEFVNDYLDLIDDYKALSSTPDIWVWSPLAPLFPGQKFHGDPHEIEIHKAIQKAARRARVPRIDMHHVLKTRPEWFPDHIHPDASGMRVIADMVSAAIEKTAGLPEPRALRMYVLTGQSNSLGTTADASETDTSAGAHPADEHVRFFWSNRSTRAGEGSAVLLGDSGGVFTSLQAQQGEGKNATFWGPEVAFAREVYDSGERDFVIVKASRGGGGNGFWSKDSRDDHMYDHVVGTVRAARNALALDAEVQVAALLYVQGESDSASEAASAGKRLLSLAKNLRRDLPNAKNMRVLVGGIAADGATRDRVREQQGEVADGDPRMVYFSTLDLREQLYDKLHFDKAAKLEIGRRFATAWASLGGARAER